MAVSARANMAAGRSASRPARVVTCQAMQGDNKLAAGAIAFAAAALLSAAPVPEAKAGVVLTQPELKKVFQSTEEPVKERPFRQANKSAPETKKADAPKRKTTQVVSSSGGIDPRSVSLPASIAAIAGLGFAISKVDAGFTDWFNESGALVRNSGNYAGFEEEVRAMAAGASPRKPATIRKTGTKVVKGKK